ncbi:MAG: DNA-directed RNA polymerase subunit beta, partial [uncultured bacterium]
QEMLTIKSDDVVGRAKAFEAIVKGVDIPESTVPESFKVLVKELNGLSLNVELIGAKEGKLGEETVTELKEEEKIKAEATELMEVSGAIQVAESDGVEPVGTPVEAEEVQSGLAKEEVKGE